MFLLAACAAGSSSATGQIVGEEERSTIWDGIYTDEQAARGERTAWMNCFACHSSQDWSGSPLFVSASSNQRLGDLYQDISRSMPEDAPGSLTPQQYADVLSYILKLQDAPPGDRELPPDLVELDQILVTPP